MMKEFFLTTVDNPFNPFKDFDKWLQFDREKGYNTSELVDRFMVSMSFLTDEQLSLVYNDAIDRIIDSDVVGRYRKVSEDSYFLER